MGNLMNDAKGTELPLLQPSYPVAQCKKRTGGLTTQLLAALCILYVYLRYYGSPIYPWFVTSASGVHWKSCGGGYGDELQCANVSVPLNYRNESDGRTINVAVTRLLAADKENRCVKQSVRCERLFILRIGKARCLSILEDQVISLMVI
jgi:hypothetical protein